MFKCLLSLLLLSPAFAGSKSNVAIGAFNEAVGFANAGQWNPAAEAASRAISADADFAQAYYLRGVARYSLQSPEGAMLDFSDALRLDSSLVEARALRGLIHYEADRYDQALEDVNAVLAVKPNDSQSLLVRGIIRLKREDKTGAAHDLNAFIRLKPEDPLVPKLKEVLASLGSAPSTRTTSSKATKSRSASTSRASSPERDAEPSTPASFQTRALSEAFGRRLLHGDAAPVVGDIEKTKHVSPEER